MDDPIPTFSYLAQRIKELYPKFAFLDATEVERPRDKTESNDFLRKIWAPKVFMSNSGYDRQKGMDLADRTGGLVGYGRSFLANVRVFFLTTASTRFFLTMRTVARSAIQAEQEHPAQYG
jgi:hypothetical protein